MTVKAVTGFEVPFPIVFNRSGQLAVAAGTKLFYNDSGRTLKIIAVRATLVVAPTGSTAIFDINKNGTTIYTTQGNRPAIAISGTTIKSTNPDVTTWADGDTMSIDVDQIGSTIPGSGLIVAVWVK